MNALDTALAVVAILAGFGVGFAFRGWYVRRVERRGNAPSLRVSGGTVSGVPSSKGREG
jgi:hypothetical protein